MPLYEYRCPECGQRFEILQKIGQGAEGLACPRCGAGRVEKQFSTFAAASTSGGGTSTGSATRGCGPGGFT